MKDLKFSFRVNPEDAGDKEILKALNGFGLEDDKTGAVKRAIIAGACESARRGRVIQEIRGLMDDYRLSPADVFLDLDRDKKLYAYGVLEDLRDRMKYKKEFIKLVDPASGKKKKIKELRVFVLDFIKNRAVV